MKNTLKTILYAVIILIVLWIGTEVYKELTLGDFEPYNFDSSDNYTQQQRSDFIGGCSSSGEVSEIYCTCLIEYIETKIPASELAANEQNPSPEFDASFDKAMKAGIKACKR